MVQGQGTLLLDGLLLGGQYQNVKGHRVFRLMSITTDAPEQGELKDLITMLPDDLTYRALSMYEETEEKVKAVAGDRIDEYSLLSIQSDATCGKEPFVAYSIEAPTDGSALKYRKRELRAWPPPNTAPVLVLEKIRRRRNYASV